MEKFKKVFLYSLVVVLAVLIVASVWLVTTYLGKNGKDSSQNAETTSKTETEITTNEGDKATQKESGEVTEQDVTSENQTEATTGDSSAESNQSESESQKEETGFTTMSVEDEIDITIDGGEGAEGIGM